MTDREINKNIGQFFSRLFTCVIAYCEHIQWLRGTPTRHCSSLLRMLTVVVMSMNIIAPEPNYSNTKNNPLHSPKAAWGSAAAAWLKATEHFNSYRQKTIDIVQCLWDSRYSLCSLVLIDTVTKKDNKKNRSCNMRERKKFRSRVTLLSFVFAACCFHIDSP